MYEPLEGDDREIEERAAGTLRDLLSCVGWNGDELGSAVGADDPAEFDQELHGGRLSAATLLRAMHYLELNAEHVAPPTEPDGSLTTYIPGPVARRMARPGSWAYEAIRRGDL